MALADVEGNRAAVYLLCHPAPLLRALHDDNTRSADSALEHQDGTSTTRPESEIFSDASAAPVDENGIPSGPAPQEMRQIGRAPTSYNEPPLRDAAANSPQAPHTAPGRLSSHPGSPSAAGEATSAKTQAWGRHTPARTRRDMLALCARLQAEAPVYRAIGSTRRLRHLLRPWLHAGWTIAGIVWAIDNKPNGDPWRYAWRTVDELRNPAGWLRHRMRRWTDDTGRPLPDPWATSRKPGSSPGATKNRSTAGPSLEVRELLRRARDAASAATAEFRRRPTGPK